MQQNKSSQSMLSEIQLQRKLKIEEENKQIQFIKEQIKRQQQELQEKDEFLKKQQEALYRQMQLERKINNQPFKSSQIQIHQREYESQKLMKEIERNHKKVDSHSIEQQRLSSQQTQIKNSSLVYQRIEKEKELNKIKELEQKNLIVNRKRKQKKYGEIVQSMMIRKVAKSEYETQDKQKKLLSSQERHQFSEYENDQQEILQLKPIDKYLIRKLEKILNIPTERQQSLLTLSSKQQDAHQTNQKNIQHKLAPINHSQSQKNSPIKSKRKSRYQESIQNHIRVPEIDINSWKSIIEDSSLSQPDKVEQTLGNIKKMNKKARLLEDQISSSPNFQKESQINNILIDNLQAKLAILDLNQ